MDDNGLDRASRRYLRSLKQRLADLPAEASESILQDVRAHIEEATATGRSSDEVLASLGNPRELAEASRAELVLHQPARTSRLDSGTILGGTSIALAVLAAVIVSFFLRAPEGQHPDAGTEPEQAMATLLESYGPGVALLSLVPAVVLLLVHFLPRRLRRWAMLGVALALSVLVFLDIFSSGLFAVPMALTAWLAATIPYARKPVAPAGEQLSARILGSLLLIFPVIMLGTGLMLGTVGAHYIPLLLWMLFSLALAIGYALNSRAAHWTVLAYGVLILGVAVFDAGILVAAFWVGGGVALALGLHGLLRLNPRVGPTDRTKAEPV